MFSERLHPELVAMTGADSWLFAEGPMAILVADPSTGIVLTSNEAARLLYGYNEEELSGLPLHQLCNVHFAGSLRRHTRRDGVELIVDATSRVFVWQGKEAEFLFITDRTEAQQNEQCQWDELNKWQAALKTKAELLALMSHEIRTPLAGVAGMAALLADTNLTGQQRDLLDTIRASSDVLMTVMNDIGDLNKIEEEKLKLESVDFNLQTAVEEVLETAGVLASQKELELTHSLDADVPTGLMGDPARLKQILLTLLSNVFRLVEAGSVKLSVSRENGPQGSLEAIPIKLKFELSESGASIPYENARALAQSFSQAVTPLSGHFDWPAVGLAICKQLASLMNGEISLSGAPGPGAIFGFSAGFSMSIIACEPEETQSFAGREVLLVQRSADERSVTRDLLAAMGMLVTEAGSTPQALALCSARSSTQQAFPLALVDWNLPVIDGIRFARLLRGQSHHKDMQVVLLAGSLASRQWEEAREAGAVDVLIKPLRERQLAKCISQAILATAVKTEPAPVFTKTPAATNHSGTAVSILLVEDNLINQMVASLCLQRLGYAVQIAEDGCAALDAFSSNRFDLILMDCHMPRMDGATATKKIREMGGYGQKVPILALTADVFQTERDRCMAAGMNDFLSKPVAAELLKSKIEFWLQRSE